MLKNRAKTSPIKMRYREVKTYYNRVLSLECSKYKQTYEEFFRYKDSLTRILCILKRVNPSISVFYDVCRVLVEKNVSEKFEDEDENELYDDENDEEESNYEDEDELEDNEDELEGDEWLDEETYFDFFLENGVLDWIFELLLVPEPCTVKEIKWVCKVLCTELNDGNTCLDFFLTKSDLSTFIELKNSLPNIYNLRKICNIFSTRIYNDDSYLEYFKGRFMLDRLVELFGSLEYSNIENLEKTCQFLNQKIPGKDQTFLREFTPYLDSLILDILENPESTGYKKFKKFCEISCLKLKGKDTIYLDFYPNNHREIEFINHTDKFEVVCKALSTKVEHTKITFFEYFRKNDLLWWLFESATYSTRRLEKADVDIRKMCETLNSKTDHGEETHLELLEGPKEWDWIFKTKIDLEKFERIIKLLCIKMKDSNEVYATFFLSEINCFQFRRTLICLFELPDAGNLLRIFSCKIYPAEKSFLKLLLESFFSGSNQTCLEEFYPCLDRFLLNISENTESTYYDTFKKNAFQSQFKLQVQLLKLFQIMKTKTCNGEVTYAVFFEEGFLESTPLNNLSIVEGYCKLLSKRTANRNQNYFEFFLEHSCTNVWNQLKASMEADDLEKACNFLSMNTFSGTDETYLNLFKEHETNANIFNLLNIVKISNLEYVCRILCYPIIDKEYRNYLDFIVSKQAFSFIFDCLKASKSANIKVFSQLITLIVSKFGPRGQYGFDFIQKAALTDLLMKRKRPLKVEDLSNLCRLLNMSINNNHETCFDFFSANELWIRIRDILKTSGPTSASNMASLCTILSKKISINLNFEAENKGKIILETSRTYFDFFAAKPLLWIKNLVEWSLVNGTENLQTICELLSWPASQHDLTCLDFLQSIDACSWFFDFLETSETSTQRNLIDVFKLLSANFDRKKEKHWNFFQTNSGSLIFKEMATKPCKPEQFMKVCYVMSTHIISGEQSCIDFFEADGLMYWVCGTVMPSTDKVMDELCKSLHAKIVNRDKN